MQWLSLYEIEAYSDCMKSRGYSLIEPGTEPRPGTTARAAPGSAQGAKP
jgi:hypothetical protein